MPRTVLRGELRLSFPARRDRRGDEHPYLRPVDDSARETIEAHVFDAIGLDARSRP